LFIVDSLSITLHHTYPANHQPTAHIAAHLIHAQYHHNNHPPAAHTHHNKYVQKFEPLAPINSVHSKLISPHTELTVNGFGLLALHFNALFAKFTIFTACNNSFRSEN
jgi:hypothetical protein